MYYMLVYFFYYLIFSIDDDYCQVVVNLSEYPLTLEQIGIPKICRQIGDKKL